MKLYNTLTRQVEEVKPQQPPIVTVYTCGPTVYDYPHVGNWFTFIRYDLLVRALKANGLQPKWVMNITDVGHLVSDADSGEDKLEKGARREHKTAWDVAEFYAGNFVAGLQKLNFTQPDFLPKATAHIQEQIDLVRKLEEKGYTYNISDGVYYDTSKFPQYADFARLDLDEQQAGARVEYDPEKRNPQDFALWKFSPKDHQRDMEWDSPWGKGFPGWHIECSAMSMKYLGETLDIHAGGIDHVPVHHTNEIAQSEAVTGKPFAHVWMHTNHISVENEKISKSLPHTMITLEQIEARGISLEAFRLHVLESHYRSQSKFSWESLEAAQKRLGSYREMADMQWQPRAAERKLNRYAHYDNLLASMQNDLNSPEALALLSAVAQDIKDAGIHADEVGDLQEFLRKVDALLGLQLSESSDITDGQKRLIAQREDARGAKDWQASDSLRDELLGQSIGVRDTAFGSVWYRQ